MSHGIGSGTNNPATNQRYMQPEDSAQGYSGALYAPPSYDRTNIPLLPHLLPFGGTPNAIGAVNRWLAAQDRGRIEPHSLTRRPAILHSPVRIVVLSNVMARDINPRLMPEASPWLAATPPEYHMPTPAREESILTPEEQNASLKKLKKEIYNPTAKKIMQRLSLYYRDNNVNNSSGEREKEGDEDGKNCAICLEDFVPRQIVMLTPCNHMFHEECIVPWVKSHGQCPVCRFAMCDRIRDRAVASNTNNINPSDTSAGDIMSVIRAMEEAYY